MPIRWECSPAQVERKLASRGKAPLVWQLTSATMVRGCVEEAHKRIGHLYPKAQLPDGTSATVVAWLWARTVPCINPACGLHMPLMSDFSVVKKRRAMNIGLDPLLTENQIQISFVVQSHDEDGVPKNGTVNRNGAFCIADAGTAVKLGLCAGASEKREDKMGKVMTAIVAEGNRRKLFLSPTDVHIQVAQSVEPAWRPRGRLPEQALGFRVQNYGITQWHQLFMERQLTALTTFSDFLKEVRDRILPGRCGSRICRCYLHLSILCYWKNC